MTNAIADLEGQRSGATQLCAPRTMTGTQASAWHTVMSECSSGATLGAPPGPCWMHWLSIGRTFLIRNPMPEVAERYDYADENGALLFQVERLRPKGFRQRRLDESGAGWVYNLDNTRRVLYRLPQVLEAVRRGQWVLIAEGEKDVHTLEAEGKVATTVPGGAGKWRPEYARHLHGAKVALVADNDGPGMGHVHRIAEALEGVAEKVRAYRPPDGHKDVTAMAEAGLRVHDLVDLDLLVDPRKAKHNTLRVMSVAELLATPDADEHDHLLEALVVRGSRLVIGAHTGEGKTSFGLQLLSSILRAQPFLSWKGQGNGSRALVLDAEQGRRTVKRRFIESGLDEFPGKVDLVHVPDGLALDIDENHIAELEAILAAGRYDVVLADPLYKLHRGEANDERKAVDLMRRFDYWRERFSFALILPMHCRKPQAGSKFSIHDILGSSGYTRGAEVVVGLQRKSRGYSHLYWWKDREGDLDCLNERWGLLFDQENGFRRDPKDLESTPLRDLIKEALATAPGLTVDTLREMTGESKPTRIERQLMNIGAVHSGERLKKERKWSLAAALPGMEAV